MLSSQQSLCSNMLESNSAIQCESSTDGSFCKMTQTMETIFAPCDSCGTVQECLKEISSFIIDLCKSHNLPNSLSPYQSTLGDLQHDWLSCKDMIRWQCEMQKDLTRLKRYFQQLYTSNNNLKVENQNQLDCIHEKQRVIDNFNVTLQEERDREDKKIKKIKDETKQTILKKEAEIKRLLTLNKNLKQDAEHMTSEIQLLQTDIGHMKVLVATLDKLRELLSSDNDNVAYENMEKKVTEIKQDILTLNSMLQENEEVIKCERLKYASLVQQNQVVLWDVKIIFTK